MKGFEVGHLEKEKKLRQNEEKEDSENEQLRQIEFQKIKEKIYLTHHSQEELESLFELIKKGILSENDLSQKINIDDTRRKELELQLQALSLVYDEVVEKQKYISEDFIVNKTDILSAIYNDNQRKIVSAKLKSGLYQIGKSISPNSSFSLGSFFFGSFFGISQNLITLQEFYIDTLGILQQIDI